MQITIPKVLLPIPLGDYHADLNDQVVWVWVNPPRAKLQERAANASRQLECIMALERKKMDKKAAAIFQGQIDALNLELYGWYAEIWSQGTEETRWTADELVALANESPSFLDWLIARSNDLYRRHREQEKKSSTPPS